MTQEQFAERVGISQAHLSRIVNRQLTPSLDVALRIASAANVPVESLQAQPAAS